jgi:ABC-type uncharacterized transport system auxiliary subunit
MVGCVRLSVPPPEVHDYRLAYEPPPAETEPLPAVLRINPFRIAEVYDRDTIVYRDGNYEIGQYFYHRWTANPARMVTDLLTRDFSSSGIYSAVTRTPSALSGDYELGGEIEELEERIVDGCIAHLRLRTILTRTKPVSSEPVLLQRTYAADEPCNGQGAQSFVAAMSKALASVSAELQRDVRQAIAGDLARHGTPAHAP